MVSPLQTTIADLNFDAYVTDNADRLASEIARQYMTWQMLRNNYLNEKAEIRNYLFATDTKKTSNSKLPWSNSTTLPKLTQIRDNLHANYLAALFPTSDWLRWEGDAQNDETEAKRKAIEGYMQTKLRQDKADVEISKLVLDYIDYGNCFATSMWKDNSLVNPATQKVTRGYVGPSIVRISPYDIVFNPLASNFSQSPKIVRAIKSLGELKKWANSLPPNDPKRATIQYALDRSIATRKAISGLDPADTLKTAAFAIDGFTNIRHYFGSHYVELLTFYGDIYDAASEELLENQEIIIIDRMFMLSQTFNDDWTNGPGIFHASWRQRPDTLYGQGPLDNLVGMQYRVDHLENMKADAFDMVGYPMFKIKGYVEEFEYQPNERIICGDDGDVEPIHPDTTILQAETQIQELLTRMEEFAGAPKEAMGIRTPGEKTKFEVQTLDNAASRMFQNKVTYFEKVFLEPLLNYMLQLARKNMSANDVSRTLDSSIDAVIFSTITKDDIIANGILRPIGARHFAERANLLQNVLNLYNSAAVQDPAVRVHLSGQKLAKLVEELTDLDPYKIYSPNIRVFENAETQSLQQHAQEQTQMASPEVTPPGVLPHDNAPPPPDMQTQQLGNARLLNFNLRNASLMDKQQ